MAQPIYSHGGPSTAGWPAISGTTQTSGNPVYIVNSLYAPAFNIFFSGTSCTVVVEGNGGLVPSSGVPPTAEWIDYSNGGYALTNGQTLSKALPKTIPCWRTRITAITIGGGTGLVSYIPAIVVKDGAMVSAGRPPSAANAYNPNT